MILIMETSCRVFLISLFFLLPLIVLSLEITKQDIKTDGAALLALKSRISSDPFQILSKNWSSGSSVCSWKGITCGSRHHRVVKLNISHMGLTCEIPPQISNLTFLVSLILRNNSFYGDLPESFASLRRLRVLSLSFNNFSGTIPPWLGRLPRLQLLYLSNNGFSELIPPAIFNITTLEEIHLTNNNISGSLPSNMCHHLPSLRGLYLSYNQITGELPQSLTNCSQLQDVSFSHNNFNGSIPNEIGNLKRLQHLYLGYNSLTGVIPSSLGNHPNLIWLRIENNQINGHIPSTMFNMSSLKYLNLANNTLSGSLPPNMCDHLPSLTEISMGKNYLEGQIPTDIHECKYIQIIDLYHNKLFGSIPRGIGNLTILQRLNLGDNDLTGEIPAAAFNISSLIYIDFSFNHLSGRLPSNFGNMLPNLELFQVTKNLLEGSIPSSISNSSLLKRIGLAMNKFRGPIPRSMGDLRLLEELRLGDNLLTKESWSSELGFITSLTNCMNLRILYMGKNPYNATLPRSVGNLSTSLTVLSIKSAGLKGNIPIEIGTLRNLEMLHLGQNELTGYIPTTIGAQKELQLLYLDDNKLQGPFPTPLCELKKLGFLSMSKNHISGSIPKCIGDLPSLREMNISENRLSSNIPESLWNLKDLLVLDLSHNSIIGSLSSEISSLRAITYLDFSNNLLSGNLPKGVGDLITLTNLSLSHNGINGSIPDIFYKLLSLEHFDLSSNNLSGALPQSLEKLKHLTFFNVSSNQLGGHIPEGGQFQNFIYKSFMSNKGFCGAPWLHYFPPCPANNKSFKKRSLMYAFISMSLVIIVLVPILILMRRKFRPKRVNNQEDPTSEVGISRISRLELQRATGGFSEEHLIGIGGSSSVYKATLKNGDVYAVKIFHSQHQVSLKSFDRECEVLRNIRHRNITKVISSCSNLNFKSLILQYMPNGSLENWLYSNQVFLDFKKRLDIMIDVGCALEYLHHGYTTPIAHCDLKPSNVLIDSDMVGHVTDFGISRLLGDEDSSLHTMTLATFGYMAPEYGTDGLVSTKCDVYSFGIMLLEVFSRKRPNDDMFNEGLSLRSWVSNALSGSLFEVIDRAILEADEEIFDKKLRAAYSVMELGLNCSEESQERRTNTIDALTTLRKIKHDLVCEK